MTPATLALITAVGPPDCATNKFPANSAIILQQYFAERLETSRFKTTDFCLNRADTLPTEKTAVKRNPATGTGSSKEAPNHKPQTPCGWHRPLPKAFLNPTEPEPNCGKTTNIEHPTPNIER